VVLPSGPGTRVGNKATTHSVQLRIASFSEHRTKQHHLSHRLGLDDVDDGKECHLLMTRQGRLVLQSVIARQPLGGPQHANEIPEWQHIRSWHFIACDQIAAPQRCVANFIVEVGLHLFAARGTSNQHFCAQARIIDARENAAVLWGFTVGFVEIEAVFDGEQGCRGSIQRAVEHHRDAVFDDVDQVVAIYIVHVEVIAEIQARRNDPSKHTPPHGTLQASCDFCHWSLPLLSLLASPCPARESLPLVPSMAKSATMMAPLPAHWCAF
jgi:hypothetical protein